MLVFREFLSSIRRLSRIKKKKKKQVWIQSARMPNEYWEQSGLTQLNSW